MNEGNQPKPNPGAWKPGKSGNPKGRPRKRHCLSDALRDVLEEAESILDDGTPLTKAQVIARLVVNKACEGQQWAVELVWDRIEGKPKQSLEVEQSVNTAAERISDIARHNLNAYAQRVISSGPARTPGDVDVPAHGAVGAQADTGQHPLPDGDHPGGGKGPGAAS